MKLNKSAKMKKILTVLLVTTLSSQSFTSVLAADSETSLAIDPVQASYGYYVDVYENNASSNTTPETNPSIGVLSKFLELFTPGTTWNDGTKLNEEVLDENIQKVADIASSRTKEEEDAAWLDDRRSQNYSIISGLGPYTDNFIESANAQTTIPETVPDDATTVKYEDTATWASTDSELGKMVELVNTVRGGAASTSPAKKYYKYMRPFRWLNDTSIVIPTLQVNISSDPSNDGGFPSGHTNAAYLAALSLAYAVPERYQEMLTRASELGNNRIVAGMHSPLDVIGGRVMATAIAAATLNDSDNSELKEAAYEQAQNVLLTQEGTSEDEYGDYEENLEKYTYRLTYGFEQIGDTTKAMVVPKGAEVLLETRLPYLDDEQRRWVLYSTGLPSGYPVLDDTEGWGRLNLFAAANGYGAFDNDVTVTMDASKGGFNAEDNWRNDISGDGSLTKKGSGTLILSGDNTYTGGTVLEEGTLKADSNNAFGTGDVANNGGTIIQNTDGGVSLDGDYTQGTDAVLELNLDSSDDTFDIAGEASLRGTLKLNFKDYVPYGSVQVITYASKGDTAFTSVEISGLSDNYVAEITDSGVIVKSAYAVDLDAPEGLAWDDTTQGMATWYAVDNAYSYKVQLIKDGKNYGDRVTVVSGSAITVTSGSAITLTDESSFVIYKCDLSKAIALGGSGTYTFSVTAMGDGLYYNDSDTVVVDEGYSYTSSLRVLSTPTGLGWSSKSPGKASWNGVSNASGYYVELLKGGSLVESVTVSGKSYDFTDAILEEGKGSYTFRVTALGDGITYCNSETAEVGSSRSYSVVKNGSSSGSSSSGKSSGSSSTASSDSSGTRQVEIRIGDGTGASSVAAEVIRTTKDNRQIDTVTLNDNVTEAALKAAEEKSLGKITLYIEDIEDNKADEVVINMVNSSVKKLAAGNVSLGIQTDDVILEIPKDTLKSLSESDKDFYFNLTPVRDTKDQAEIYQNAITAKVVAKAAGNGKVTAFGTPMKIETNYKDLTTKVTFSLDSITIPSGEAEKKAFLDSLWVYILHSGTEEELSKGTIQYDEKGNPSGIEIEITKFSTFTILSISNEAPAADSLNITGEAVVGNVLTAAYTYEDAENDEEGISSILWYRADNKNGEGKTLISGAEGLNYKLTSKDQGKYVICQIIPVAKTGETTGAVVSAAVKVNAVPKALSVKISGKLKVGSILTGSYTYKDAEGDKEGSSIYKWYRADDRKGTNKQVIKGAKELSYMLTEEDTGKYITFEVTPVALSGSKTGSKVSYTTKSALKDAEKETVAVTEETTKYNSHIKLGVVGSYTYAKELADIIAKKYGSANVTVKEEGKYYRVYADFKSKASAKEACEDLIHKNYIINYYFYTK